MFCGKCGQKNEEAAMFCVYCGQHQTPQSSGGDAQIPAGGSLPTEALTVKQPPRQADSDINLSRTLQHRYRLVRELGAGGMGKVYLARDIKMEYDVVVKEMLPYLIAPKERKYIEEHFKDEAKMLYRLKHLGLPRVTDYFFENNSIYIIMEYIEGEDLETLIKKRSNNRIEIFEFFYWMSEVLRVLRYLHNQEPPIIHRDIKPGNIMLTKRNEIVLVDFGVARTIAAKAGTQTRVGTPGFASPEHFFGKFILSSDIYSLGATFHYLVSGDDPRSRNPFDYPPLDTYRSDIPQGMQKLMDKMLDPEPDMRYGIVEEVERDLRGLCRFLVAKGSLDRRHFPETDALVLDESFSVPPGAVYPQMGAVPGMMQQPMMQQGMMQQPMMHQGMMHQGMMQQPMMQQGMMQQPIMQQGMMQQPMMQQGMMQQPMMHQGMMHQGMMQQPMMQQGMMQRSHSSSDLSGAQAAGAVAAAVIKRQQQPQQQMQQAQGQQMMMPQQQQIQQAPQEQRVYTVGSGVWQKVAEVIFESSICSVAFSPDGNHLCCGTGSNTIQLLDVNSHEMLMTFVGHTDWVRAVTYSPDGKFVVSGGDDKYIRMWDASNGNVNKELFGHEDWVRSVKYSPCNNYVVSGSYDGKVKIWSTRSWNCVVNIPQLEEAINSVDYSPDGKFVIGGCDDSKGYLWNARSGSLVTTFEGHESYIYATAFSQDSTLLATGSGDTTVKIWDVNSGACIKTFQGHEDSIFTVAFSPDGSKLVSGGDDMKIRVWNVATGECEKVLEGHSRSVYTAAFSPTGTFFVTGSGDKSLLFWSL